MHVNVVLVLVEYLKVYYYHLVYLNVIWSSRHHDYSKLLQTTWVMNTRQNVGTFVRVCKTLNLEKTIMTLFGSNGL